MKKLQLASVLATAVVTLAACGGGGDSYSTVRKEQIVLEEGKYISYQLSSGTYDATITSSNHGVTVSWLGGSNCQDSAETKNYSGVCTIEKSGQLIIANPTALYLGGDEVVAIRVDKKD